MALFSLTAMTRGGPIAGGEFNRSVQHQLQSIGRGFEGQGLSRALIEPQSNGIEVGLREAREIGSSREVLSQQAVGVLVAATLPWTSRGYRRSTDLTPTRSYGEGDPVTPHPHLGDRTRPQ